MIYPQAQLPCRCVPFSLRLDLILPTFWVLVRFRADRTPMGPGCGPLFVWRH